MKPPVVIGVAGCSGSGKTALASELARELEGTLFHLDHYYRDLSHMALEERRRQNFDHPDQIESSLLIAHVRELLRGRAIAQPRYDFAQHTRRTGVMERVEAMDTVLVDGIFALYYPELRSLYSLSIYVDTPDEVCYARRLARDIRERGRSEEDVAAHYAETVRPMSEQFVRPCARYADLVVDGTVSLDWGVEQALAAIRSRGLLRD